MDLSERLLEGFAPVARPLRCTSLHHTILAHPSPSNNTANGTNLPTTHLPRPSTSCSESPIHSRFSRNGNVGDQDDEDDDDDEEDDDSDEYASLSENSEMSGLDQTTPPHLLLAFSYPHPVYPVGPGSGSGSGPGGCSGSGSHGPSQNYTKTRRMNSGIMPKRRRTSSGVSKLVRPKGLMLSPQSHATAMDLILPRPHSHAHPAIPATSFPSSTTTTTTTTTMTNTTMRVGAGDEGYESILFVASPDRDRHSFLADWPGGIEQIRRVNYRRGALLPKPKSFHRVALSLSEEAAPLETDVRREAALARILKEKDEGLAHGHGHSHGLGIGMGIGIGIGIGIGGPGQAGNADRVGVLAGGGGSCGIGGGPGTGCLDDRMDALEECLAASIAVGSRSDENDRKATTDEGAMTTTPGSVGSTTFGESREYRGRSGKRKREARGSHVCVGLTCVATNEERFEPYLTFKRRAVSPSPNSPPITPGTGKRPNSFPQMQGSVSLPLYLSATNHE